MRRAVLARLLLLVVFLLVNVSFVFAQGSKLKTNENHEPDIEEQDDPLGRELWFLKGRQTPDGSLPALWNRRAFDQKMQMRANFRNRLRLQIDGAQSVGITPNATIPVGSGTTIWSPMGPGPMVDDNLLGQNYGPNVGRVTAVAVNPADSTGNTVVIGTASGGVWFSSNGAATDPKTVFWTPLFDHQPTTVIGSVSWKPDGSIVLAGTGEGNAAIDSYYGQGIFRLDTATETWTQITSSADGHSFLGLGMQRQAWSKTSPNVAAISTTVAARNEGAFAGASLQGLYYSTDSGTSWRLATFFDSGVQVTAPAPSSNSVVWNASNHKFYAHLRAHGIYVSRNADDPSIFDRLGAQPDAAGTGLNLAANCPTTTNNLTTCPIYRAELAAHPSRNELYVWYIDGNINHKGIWKSLDGGATWVQLTDTGFTSCGESSGCGPSQAFYNMSVLAISNPTTASQTDLYVNAVNQFKCTIDNSANNGNEKCANITPDSAFSFKNLTHVYGCNFGGDIANVHPDQHDMSAALGTKIIYFGHDGGISRTLDSSQLSTGVCSPTGQKLNAYDNLNFNMGAATQYIWGTAIPNDARGMIAGSQDNGSAAVFGTLTPTNGQTWRQINGGDGGYNDIDPNGTTWYTANTGVTIQKSTSGLSTNRNSWSTIATKTNVGNDASGFYTPYMLDPQLTTKILIGTCRIWRGPNTSWSTTPGTALSTVPLNRDSVCGDDSISAIAAGGPLVAGVGSKVLYQGTAAGSIFRTLDSSIATPVWANVSPDTLNPNHWQIGGIAVDTTDATGQTVYVAIQGFGVAHVLKSTNAGTSWTAIGTVAAGLPDSPANTVIVDPDDHNVIYVGNDVGVFALDQTAGGTTWVEVGPEASTGNAGYIPNVPVYRLVRQDLNAGATKILKAVTYGRGVWVAYLTGGGPVLSFTPASPIDFGTVAVGSSSSQTITFTNTGTAALTVVAPSPIADTTNSWEIDSISCGNLPVAVQPGGSCQVNITFHPTVGGTLNTTFTLDDNSPGNPHVIQLNGVGSTPGPSFSASPNPVAFSNTPINTDSTPIFVTITNGGGQPLNITSVTPANMTAFVRQSGNCPTSTGTIAVGGSCTDDYVFHPTNTTPQTGILTFVTNAANSPNVVTFSGTGTATPVVHFSSTTLAFGNQNTGTTSANQTVTVTNTGTGDLHIGTVTISAQYNKVTDNCSGTAVTATTGSCTITVNFAPTATGAQNGTLTVPSDATTSPDHVTLTGTGTTPGAQVAPTTLTFTSTMIGTATAGQDVTVTNNGTGPLTFTSITISGTNASSFGQTNTCPVSPATLAAGANCKVTVKMTAQSIGALTATLAIADNAAGSPQNVTLNGTGAPSTYTAPSPLAFGSVALNTPSTLFETITNTGTGPITLAPSIPAGMFVLNGGTCTASLAANSACTIGVKFTPTNTTPQSVNMTLNSNGNGPATVTLTGTGVNTAISANPSSVAFTGTLVGNTSAPTPVIITNVSSSSVTISALTIGGTDSTSFLKDAGCAGAVLAQNATCTVNVSFKPTKTGALAGTLTLSNAPNPDLVVNLSGTGTQPGILFAPTGPIAFGNQRVGTTSTAQNVTITNNGTATLNVTAINVPAPYVLNLNTCATLPKALASNTSCIIQIQFAPTVVGAAPASNLSVTDDAPSSPQTVALTGTGTQSNATITGGPLAFGNQNVGTTSTTKTITITNQGGTDTLNIGTITVVPAGQFVTTADNCSGKVVAIGNNCTVGVQFKPTASGLQNANLNIPDDAPGNPHSVAMSGTGTVPGPVVLTPPAPMNFPNTLVNQTSTGQVITVTNSGTGVLTFSGVTITGTNAGDFNQTNTCTSGTVGAGLTCTITVTFKPTATGARTATINIADDAAGSPQTYVVNGTGTGAVIDTQIAGVSATSIAFGNQRKGVASTEKQFQVKNTGNIDLHVSGVSLSGTNAPDFTITTNTCSVAVPAGTTCTVGVKFTPGSTGNRSASVNISSDALSGNSSMALSGTGIFPAITTNPTANALDFSFVKVNTTSATKTFTLTNSGTDTLNITASVVAAAGYNVTNNCGVGTVAAAANCTIVVAFAPTTAGASNDTVTLTHDLGTTVLNLTGTAEVPAVTPNPTVAAGVSFGGKPITTSSTQTVTLSNTSHVALAINSVTISGTGFSQSNNCGTSVAGQANCTITVTFNPATTGAKNGTLTVTTDAASPNNSMAFPLSGTGEDFAQSTGTTTATVTAGNSASFTMTETPTGGNFTNAITFSCTGLDTTMGCAFNPPQVTPGSTAVTTTLTITTKARSGTAPAGLSAAKHGSGGVGLLAFLLALPGMAVFFPTVGSRKLNWRKKAGMLLLLLVVLTLVMSMAGCSTGSSGTKAGTYNIGVVATSGGLSHTTNVSVTVQ